MTTNDWYMELLTTRVLYEWSVNDEKSLYPLRCEVLCPENNWQQTWRFLNLQGLSTEQRSFLFRLLHRLIPTGQRLLRFKKSDSSRCTLCNHNEDEDLSHALLRCDYNGELNHWIINWCRKIFPTLSIENILGLNLGLRSDEKAFPVVWSLATLLEAVARARSAMQVVVKSKIRADLEAKVDLLRKTRYESYVVPIEDFLEL